jgi:two-component system sensor histidine kinase AlgZ
LEALSDLFRAAMRDPGALVSLADEIALGEQYLALEKLRLGERLQIVWQIGEVPMALLIPPLMLQPLLENAVYHGIEPAPDGGLVKIVMVVQEDALVIRISNPTTGQIQHAAGNQMAVANIRERLALYYDLESRLEIDAGEQSYEVSIILPCRQKPH